MDPEKCLAYMAAYRYARKYLLSVDDAEDCASENMEREWEAAGSLEALYAQCKTAPALIRKSASDCAKNWVRGVSRRMEVGSESGAYANDRLREWHSLTSRPNVDAGLLHEAFWAIVLEEMGPDRSEAEDWFLRHHRYDEPVNEIAESCGKDANAVSVAIFRERRKIRRRLSKTGITEIDLREYTSPPITWVWSTARRRRELGDGSRAVGGNA